MFKTTLTGALTAVGVGAALLAGTTLPAEAQEHTFSIVFLANTEDEDYDGSLVFKDWVESRSNGEIAVEIYPGGQLCGNATECIDAVQSGLVTVFITTIGGLGAVFPPSQVMDVPYMFPNDRVAECALASTSPFFQELRSAVLEETGTMRLMTIGNTGGWRNFATTDTAIHSPADVEGLRIRTIESDIQQELVRSMGGTPTPVAWPELYTALGTGVVEGTKNGITDIIGMSFHEHLNNLTLDGHAYMGALWWLNQDAWSALSDQQRRIVEDGFDRLRLTTLVMPQRRAIEAYQTFTDAGGIIYVPSEEEMAQFREAAQPIRQWYVDAVENGQHWLDLLDQTVADCEAEIGATYTME